MWEQIRELLSYLVGAGIVTVLAVARELFLRRVRALATQQAGAKASIGACSELIDRLASDPPPPSESGSELDPLSRRLLIDLHDSIRPMAVQLLREARDQGIRIVITSGYRSLAQQQALWDQGRAKPGRVVTWARPGTSWHNFGLAFDVAPLDQNGKPHWPNDWRLWMRLGELGESIGLTWGGRWKKPDLPHFEYHPNITLAQAQRGVRPV